VEQGSSHVAARLLSLALTMSCVSTIQAAIQCHVVRACHLVLFGHVFAVAPAFSCVQTVVSV
jgi:hypothetical protein